MAKEVLPEPTHWQRQDLAVDYLDLEDQYASMRSQSARDLIYTRMCKILEDEEIHRYIDYARLCRKVGALKIKCESLEDGIVKGKIVMVFVWLAVAFQCIVCLLLFLSHH